MEGAFRDLVVCEGFDVNHFGGAYSNGKAHSYTTKLKVAAVIALAHVISSGEPANIRAISQQCNVEPVMGYWPVNGIMGQRGYIHDLGSCGIGSTTARPNFGGDIII